MQYTETTDGIKISVQPVYNSGQSQPGEGLYTWSYFIKIENLSEDTVQLLNRYWHITDALGRVQEVRGPGVVGYQPVLKKGECFEYNSGTHLDTPSGIMQGLYEMQRDDGLIFSIKIPAFSLDSPGQIARPN